MHHCSLHVPATASAVPDAAASVARFGAQAGLDEQCAFRIQVVVAEALNNIVLHGYARAEFGTIQIHCVSLDDRLEIDIQDCGTPLDDLPNHRLPDCRCEHGRGWPIILNWADTVEYRVEPSHNQLTLTKLLG